MRRNAAKVQQPSWVLQIKQQIRTNAWNAHDAVCYPVNDVWKSASTARLVLAVHCAAPADLLQERVRGMAPHCLRQRRLLTPLQATSHTALSQPRPCMDTVHQRAPHLVDGGQRQLIPQACHTVRNRLGNLQGLP